MKYTEEAEIAALQAELWKIPEGYWASDADMNAIGILVTKFSTTLAHPSREMRMATLAQIMGYELDSTKLMTNHEVKTLNTHLTARIVRYAEAKAIGELATGSAGNPISRKASLRRIALSCMQKADNRSDGNARGIINTGGRDEGAGIYPGFHHVPGELCAPSPGAMSFTSAA